MVTPQAILVPKSRRKRQMSRLATASPATLRLEESSESLVEGGKLPSLKVRELKTQSNASRLNSSEIDPNL